MSPELKPCPFCGCKPYYTESVNGSNEVMVGCSTCDFRMFTVKVYTTHGWHITDDIPAKWNTRSAELPTKEQPASGALERGAAAVQRLFDLASTPPDSGFSPEDVAKAVLDAVGVSYVD